MLSSFWLLLLWEPLTKGERALKNNNNLKKKKSAFLHGGEEPLANLLSRSVLRNKPLTQSPIKNEFFPNEMLKNE